MHTGVTDKSVTGLPQEGMKYSVKYKKPRPSTKFGAPEAHPSTSNALSSPSVPHHRIHMYNETYTL